MKKIFFLILMGCVAAGCETTISFPPGYHASDKPKEVQPVILTPVEGRTPLELLKAEKRNVETVYYPDWGNYVSRIANVRNETELGPNGRYWILYINNKRVEEGLDRIRLKGDEKVEFRFEAAST
ncbi:MAG: DUF4430 domain-containing protein [Candidatus Omnitrophica bacterium]|nr:DUF4430 domain-containing protein [Candidatus Omnitrophota bacterium]